MQDSIGDTHGDAIGAERARGPARLLSLLLPAALLGGALLLPHLMFSRELPPAQKGLGPGAWPELILGCLAFFAAIWVAQEAWTLARGGGSTTLRAPVEEETYDYTKALVGIALIVVYGAMISVTGFALTTAMFIAVWCIYGGIRKLSVVIPVSLIGTAALLWLFMGLALMPLSRGRGPFDELSIWLLRTLGIY